MSFGPLAPVRDVFAGTSSCSPISKMPAGSLYFLTLSTSAHVMVVAEPPLETSGIRSGVLSRLHARAAMGLLHAAYAYVERVPGCLAAAVRWSGSGSDGLNLSEAPPHVAAARSNSVCRRCSDGSRDR
jgi:hypothetical protein